MTDLAMTARRSTARPDDMPKQSSQALEIDVAIESALWDAVEDAEAQVTRAIVAAAESEAHGGGAVSVLLTDDSAIQVLNLQWRGQDKATNVLSFPAATPPGFPGPKPLGDIAISYETVVAEAIRDGKPFEHHLVHLAVHGFLHLIGYDHESDGDAEDMENKERRILAGLAIPDPYDDRKI